MKVSPWMGLTYGVVLGAGVAACSGGGGGATSTGSGGTTLGGGQNGGTPASRGGAGMGPGGVMGASGGQDGPGGTGGASLVSGGGTPGAVGGNHAAGGQPAHGGATTAIGGGATANGGTSTGGAMSMNGGTSSTGGISASSGGTSMGAPAFWPSGTDGLSRDFADAFGAWRGRPSTSAWINVHWLSWDWLTTPGLYSTLDGTNPVKVYDLYAGWSGVLVLSMSMAGADSSTNYDQNMRGCATGSYDTYWQTFARNATSAGRTGANTVVSLAHEFNGTWFKWNPGNVGIDVWTSCWRHVYTAIHSTSSLKIVWVMSASSNTKKGGDYSVNTAWDAYPGDDYVDIVGINRYDFKSLSSSTTTNWMDTCNNTQDICYVAKYARMHGKPIGVPEWSMDRGQYGWGDLPSFVDLMYGFFKDNADILAFENNFDNGGSGDWNFYPENASNMMSAEEYKKLWKQ